MNASLRRRLARRRKNRDSGFELQLTSMLDVLVIILVFLLKTYQTNKTSTAILPGLTLPISESRDEPEDSFQVAVTTHNVIYNGREVAPLVHTSDGRLTFAPGAVDFSKLRVLKLFEAMKDSRKNATLITQMSHSRDEKKDISRIDILSLSADKSIDYDVLRLIMNTGAQSGFKVIRMVAKRREE